MTPGLRTAVLVPTLAALFLLPAAAEAQRQATARVPPPRTSVAVPRSTAPGYYRPPYYRPYYYRPYSSYYYPYGYYSPYFYGSYGFGIGFGVGFGYGYAPYSYPYSYPYYPYYAQYPYFGPGYYDVSTSLRLQVTPRETEVYIDGYYAGTVDDFDGTFQRLHLEPGEHELQLYLPGHRNFSQKVYLQPAGTLRVRHTMEPLKSGDPEPVKPSANAPPPGTSSQARASRRPPGPPPPPRGDQDQGRDRPANADFGSVALRVQPGDAGITIDGERWEAPGENERLTIQLSAGVHNVQIRKDGYRTYNTDVTVRRGETTSLNVALTKQ